MPPVGHMAYKGTLKYLKFVSSSVMVPLAQIPPSRVVEDSGVPSVCFCFGEQENLAKQEFAVGSAGSDAGNHCGLAISVLLRTWKPSLLSHSDATPGQGLVF